MPNAPTVPRPRAVRADVDRGRRPRRRRYLWPTLLAVLGLTVGGVGVFVYSRGGHAAPAATPQSDPASTAATASPSTVASPTPSPLLESPVLRLPGPIPNSGPGTYIYDRSVGPVLGRAGTLRRFRVAVEENVAAELRTFSAMVDTALGDPRSWIASGQLRLQRVPPGAAYDFTIYLVTAETSGKLCRAGGVNNSIGGRPYTSCRVGGKVVINLERWRLSVRHYTDRNVPLNTYRLYVINHEVGHVVGHSHERCPAAGRPAPVMQQQSLGLDGCTANPWPYLNGRRYAGPPK